ncbi:MAG: AraC family transcriptional regulator [Leptospiraceae bacterium]|nr:AraC family transcriptional regulator [Leptospiraceae bacterium]
MSIQSGILLDETGALFQNGTMAGLHPMDHLPAFAFLALVFALGELFVVQIKARNLLLAGIFLGYAMLLIRAWLLLTRRMHLVAPVFEVTMPAVFFLGPFLRAFLQHRVLGQTLSGRSLWIHLIPAFLSIAVLIPNWMESTPEKMTRIEAIYAGKPRGPGLFLFPLGLLHILLYMGWTLRDTLSVVSLDSLKQEGVLRASLLFPVVISLGTGIALMAVLSGQFFLLNWSITIVALNGPLVYFVQRRYPQFYHDLENILLRERDRNRYQKSRLTGIDVEELEARLKVTMVKEEAFRSEDLTLADLAGRLDITPHQLSEYINHNRQMNLSTFVNRYRIEAACRLLLEDPQRTVLSVAYEVGFNSKSAFNESFQKQMGMSPGRYRKEGNQGTGGR